MNGEYFQEFLALALIHFIAVIVPGPDFVVTIRQSIRFGRLHSIFTALGIGSGLSVHVIYTLLGLSAIIQSTPEIMLLMKVLGVGYLIFIGFNCIFSNKNNLMDFKVENTDKSEQSLNQSFWLGFMTNATNPKATLFFVAVMTSVVSINTPLQIQMYYGGWMCFVNALWFVLVGVIFSSDLLRNKLSRNVNLIEAVLGSLLLLFAIRLAFL
ncbi:MULTISPECIES: LysE family translocator [Pseudoalteromonas]|uniref:Lysine transporter LysE n=1 Tax=Pseudoalteromonas amylolytica TaxID=1859457 RepID=A0A1S1N0C9_9GAMM|nr:MULTISPECIES: LysE family translocator [Pseudoalteromonas]OHU90570.1 lysine transporter LysE [Pseudoalteromonas sp. JW3]OHU92809.1 lysine transporter LysE [Pseudoalteromonas amylolytica]